MPINSYRKHKELQKFLFKEGVIEVTTIVADHTVAIVKLNTGGKITVPVYSGDSENTASGAPVRLMPRIASASSNGLKLYGLTAKIYAKK